MNKLTVRFLVTSVILAVIIFMADVAFHAMAVPNLYEGYPQRSSAGNGRADALPVPDLPGPDHHVPVAVHAALSGRRHRQGDLVGPVGGLFVVLPNMQFFVGVASTTWLLLGIQVVEAIVLLIVAGVLFDLVHRRHMTGAA